MKAGIQVDRSYASVSRAIHGSSQARGWTFGETLHPPVVRTNTYRLKTTDQGHGAFCSFASPSVELSGDQPRLIYERLLSPNKVTLGDQLAMLENGQAARVFATGMAAINGANLAVLDARLGHTVLSDKTLYGCTWSLFNRGFPRRGIAVDFVDTSDIAAVANGIKDSTRVLYFESPANPNLKLTDIAALRQLVDSINTSRPAEKQIIIVMDNTFATCWAQRPLDLGVDLSVLSLTKNMNGFGTRMGGAVIFNAVERFLTDIDMEVKDGGGVMLDEAAWDYLVYSIPTLPMRMPIKVKNAQAIAAFLETHAKIGQGNVMFPGLPSFPQYELAQRQMSTGLAGEFCPGDMIYFQLAKKPGEAREAHLERTKAFLDYIAENSYPITLAVSLGVIKTLIESPALMTHSSYSEAALIAAGFLPGGIRLAVGCENQADLIHDIEEALDKAA